MKAIPKVNASYAPPTASITRGIARPSLSGHLQIARIDHWIKNVFVIPGIVVALNLDPAQATLELLMRTVVGLLAACLVASSNYTINELMDAPTDYHHPTKFTRPVPSGRVSIPFAYAQWIILMIIGIGLGGTVSIPFAVTMLVLWVMGCIYNIPPVRSKDHPYIDVLSEAINNPLRMLAGWFIVGTNSIAPPFSLLLSYWMIGCYFMAIKRFAELRHIGNPTQAAAYRKSFMFYTEQRLLISIMFYGSAAMLFLGAFIMRYRLEFVIAFPFVALVMAEYLAVAFKDNSAAQAPERLHREPILMVAVAVCALVMGVLLWVNIPIMHRIFAPITPVNTDVR